MKCEECGCQTTPAMAQAGASFLYRLARQTRLEERMLFVLADGKTFTQRTKEGSHQTPVMVIQGSQMTVRFDKQALWLHSVSRTNAEFLYVEILNSK